MIITSISGGLVALYDDYHYAVKTRSDRYVFSAKIIERVIEEIKQIRRVQMKIKISPSVITLLQTNVVVGLRYKSDRMKYPESTVEQCLINIKQIKRKV